LADSRYDGSKYIDKIQKTTGVILLSKPKKTSNIKKNESYIISKKHGNEQ